MMTDFGDKDFLFSEDADMEDMMKDFIRANFAELLGEDSQLLDIPGGLDAIQEKVQAMLAEKGITADSASLEDPLVLSAGSVI